MGNSFEISPDLDDDFTPQEIEKSIREIIDGSLTDLSRTNQKKWEKKHWFQHFMGRVWDKLWDRMSGEHRRRKKMKKLQAAKEKEEAAKQKTLPGPRQEKND